jgi:Ca-activated chloride channel family protein
MKRSDRNNEQSFGRLAVVLLAGLVLSAFVLSSALAAAQNRPRNAQTPAAAQNQTPKPATATPSPTPKPSGGIPTLGEPPPIPKLKPTPEPTPPPELTAEDTLVTDTNLVQLHVRVIDRNNRPIDNVAQDQFHVFEDGALQTITSFTREEVPISYGLAVDTSGSLRSQLQSVIDAGKTIINSNKKGDETFLVRFISSDKIETVQDFTANKDLLTDGLDSFYIEGGQTAIIDAVYLSAEHVSEYKRGDNSDRRRRALIVITDGEDRNSFYKQEQLFARLREEDVQIFVIGFVNELDKDAGFIRKSPKEKATTLINKLATETGGRAFFPESISELPQIANEIIRDLRTQYVLSYSPSNNAQDGTYRAIKVSVDQGSSVEKRIALTRTGRMAKGGGDTKGPKAPPVRLPTATPSTGTSTRRPTSP